MRRTARPYGQSVSKMRLVSMLMATVVLYFLYERLKDPATWRVIIDDRSKSSAQPDTPKTAEAEPEVESLVLGPNDQDEDEVAAISELFEMVIDRSPLKPREMSAYWRLMDWSRTVPFKELEKRAREDVPFTQLWEQPDRYRGKPIWLRLHVRRVLVYDAPENSSGIKKVGEAWGWTDESKSFPYVIVFPDPPESLPVGTDIRTEVVFAGYFLKIMGYTAFDHQRGAPLLVGRIRMTSTPVAAPPSKLDPWVIPIVAIGGVLFIGFSVVTNLRGRRKPPVKMLPRDLATDSPGEFDSDNPFRQFALDEPDRPLPEGLLDVKPETNQQSSADPAQTTAIIVSQSSAER